MHEADTVLADVFQHMFDMVDNQFERRVLHMLAVFTQEADRVIDADHATAFADRGELLVGQIARVRAERMRSVMRMTASVMLSSGVTNSQAPPVCSASSLSRLSAGALPTPIAKIRWLLRWA